MLHFNHLCGFCSSSFLSQLGLCKLLVFGKVCFDLIKHNLFFFIHFFFLLLFSHLFGVFRFFCFYQYPDNSPPKKIALPVRVRVWTSFRVRTVFTGGKKGNFLHANEIFGFFHLLYVQSCTFL